MHTSSVEQFLPYKFREAIYIESSLMSGILKITFTPPPQIQNIMIKFFSTKYQPFSPMTPPNLKSGIEIYMLTKYG